MGRKGVREDREEDAGEGGGLGELKAEVWERRDRKSKAGHQEMCAGRHSETKPGES